VVKVFAEGQALGQRRDAIVLGLMAQSAYFAVLDVDVLGP